MKRNYYYSWFSFKINQILANIAWLMLTFCSMKPSRTKFCASKRGPVAAGSLFQPNQTKSEACAKTLFPTYSLPWSNSCRKWRELPRVERAEMHHIIGKIKWLQKQESQVNKESIFFYTCLDFNKYLRDHFRVFLSQAFLLVCKRKWMRPSFACFFTD